MSTQLSTNRLQPQDALLGTNNIDTNLLAKEMNALTVEERDLLYDEIHGVADVVEETPELVETRLQHMRDGLSKISRRQRRALDRAFFLKPALAQDDKFHLVFLRAEHFDPDQAAAKMARYFQHKQELWGDDKLVKRITLDDLGEKEIAYMYSASMQTPMVNDRGLRAAYWMLSSNKDLTDWKAYMRYAWYQRMTLILEDEAVQKKGMVTVVSFHGPWNFPISQVLEFNSNAIHMLKDWPIRLRGLHYCYDSPTLDRIISICLAVAGTKLRLHNRTHFGSPIETEYSLLSYGIQSPPGAFTHGTGVHSWEHTETHIIERRRIESEILRREEESQDGSVLKPYHQPRPNDVLMGRGRAYWEWPGNVRLFDIVAMHANQYTEAEKRADKTHVAFTIVRMIQGTGNFLERKDIGWVIVDDSVAKEKVSQLLRAKAREQHDNINPISLDDFEDDEEHFKRLRLS